MPAAPARSFDVTPPAPAAAISLILLAGVLPAGIFLASGNRLAQWDSAAPSLLGMLTFILVMMGGMLLLMRRRSVTLAGGSLHIRAAMYSKRIAVSDIDLQQARTVNLDERTELRPSWKSNGYSTIGFTAGHYRMRQGLGKCFCLLTDRSRVLWLPLRDGKQHILLSLERPQAVLDALQSPNR